MITLTVDTPTQEPPKEKIEVQETTMKVYVVGGSYGYSRWLADRIILVESVPEADLVLFTGGEDVFPGLYKEPRGENTYFGAPQQYLNGLPRRDHMEILAYEAALLHKKPMFGVCRGMQFLTVMNGGTLIQHVTRHAGSDHNILWFDGTVTDTTSLHHQMCNPYNLKEDEYEVLAVSQTNRSEKYLNGWNKPVKIPNEPEAIYFPKTKSMGIQGHPEMYYRYDTPLHNKLRELIQQRLF